MVYVGGLLGLAALLLWLFSIIDVITAEEADCRALPKLLWLLVVLLAGTVGAVLWLLFGRPQPARSNRPPDPVSARFPEYDRPNRAMPTDPLQDEAFLAGLRERAAAQRRREAERRNGQRLEEHSGDRREDQPSAGSGEGPDDPGVDAGISDR
ncbi:PLDc N-terminal domain-containing protein [Actinomycetospora soli]|uniref:PLDc N-terminal domain-containing protein n=1 Tax=Actinomycetospora soli TaxID=2893887 RepID=UPI001E4D988A|nr:PLDc N-terminal domain-containing protein [Actinomycetospora soli]MCD2191252.1 PLDc N-terminal domain-containing protein [Actinomycetospora soli]